MVVCYCNCKEIDWFKLAQDGALWLGLSLNQTAVDIFAIWRRNETPFPNCSLFLI